ncbi:serine protease 27-like [Rhineura floridana]|uniref:serine protease 27-like n=1 Tax=Rhineura floridana TaxID=261503 RepID=UPI002AC83145|nr:serine protease 27-like [Rhineura floridana]
MVLGQEGAIPEALERPSHHQPVAGWSPLPESWVVQRLSISDPSLFVVVLGAHNVSYPGPEAVSVLVKHIIVHSHFSGYRDGNDIALMELDAPVNFTRNILPACIPGPSISFLPRLGCWVTGWGNIQPGVPLPDPEPLQEVLLPLMDTVICEALYSDFKDETPTSTGVIKDDMMCAGYLEGKRDACQGDSGGPLICPHDGAWLVAGVVSWGDVCAAPNRPGVYTRVSAHSSWILRHAPEVAISFINGAPSRGCSCFLVLIVLYCLD